MPNSKPRPSIEEFSQAVAERIIDNLDRVWLEDLSTCSCCSEYGVVNYLQIAKEIEKAMLELYGK